MIFFAPFSLFAGYIEVTNLQCYNMVNPLGIDSQIPILSWNLISKQRNVTQIAYRIIVSDNINSIKKNIGTIWDSKKVNANQSIQIEYKGKKVVSQKIYYWRVMVWDNKGNQSTWSSIAHWQMGLLTPSDWKNAQWIGYEKMPDSLKVVPAIHGNGKNTSKINEVLPLLRKEFTVKKQIKNATAFISGLGHFDFSLNGKKIGDHFLDPGWTQYNKHAMYVTFDITKQLVHGKNAIGIMLGNGFYYVPNERYRKLTGAFGFPKMIGLITLNYTDGSTENIITDQSWKTHSGPITFSSIYGGEDYDATLEKAGWNTIDFEDKNWNNAVIVNKIPVLNSQTAFPLKILDTFNVKKITTPKNGIWVYDMGQNASAIPKITVKGKKGDKIRITPSELLNDEGMITQEAVGAPVYFQYTLKGNEEEIWQPQFTYYGFRYVQIEGAVPQEKSNLNNSPVITNLQSLHIRNAATTIGEFSCSNSLFNQIFNLINWAIKSNMVSVLTDCPHREKLGWLEEAHLVGSSIRYNYDIASLCKKIVKDMMNSQTEDGLIPDIAPEYVQFGAGFRDSPEWGSNSIIMPWYMYKWYGDKQILKEAYPMMKRYIGYLQKKANNNILSHGLGDWFDIGPKTLGESQLTPKGITATAYYFYDLKIISKVANLIGKQPESKEYENLALKVKTAFNNSFFDDETKQYGTGSQTANAMAIFMELVALEDKDAVLENIVKDIRNKGNALTAGDIGYRYLVQVLEDNGRSDVIFDMNSRSDVPGYGYQLAHGATSLTESWQAYRNVSNNHFMLGHLMEWFYSGLGGIKQEKTSIASKQIVIRPETVGDISWAKTSYISPYGKITTDWMKSDTAFELITEIPVNTTAIIYIPTNNSSGIIESGKLLKKGSSIKLLKYEKGKAVLKVGSGIYNFKTNINKN